jgi:O-antigen/teichoic acid export membrane protein
MLYGADYLKAVPFLGLFAIFLSLYSLVNIFVSYYISINESGLALLTLPAAVLQVFLIIFFHQDISQIAGVSIAVLGLLVLFFIWYHFFYEKEN